MLISRRSKKRIITRCLPVKNVTGRYTSIFNESQSHVIIWFYFVEGEILIPQSEKSRVYPSVREEIKQNLGKGIAPKRAKHKTLNKLDVIDAVSSAIGQTHEILRTLKPKNTDPILIEN